MHDFASAWLANRIGWITLAVVTLSAASNACCQQPSANAPATPFRTIIRPRAVELDKEYDLTGLSIPEQQIHRLLPRDAIPALTDPKLEATSHANWLQPEARVIEVVIKDAVLGVPLQILDRHEVINTELAGEPIAITYCPLCDSAGVFSRRIWRANTQDTDEVQVFEFGVSGALYHSNVLLYDRTHRGLWSQLGMKAISGPWVGSVLKTLPVRLITFAQFKSSHPDGKLVSRETGHRRDYDKPAYEDYFKSDRIIVPILGVGNQLPRKTLGVGIQIDQRSVFVPKDSIPQEGFVLETERGQVRLGCGPAGMVVEQQPPNVQCVQTIYYSWSAFYPNTEIIDQ